MRPVCAVRLRAQLAGMLGIAAGMQGLVHGPYREKREGVADCRCEDMASTNQRKTGSLFAAGFRMAALTSGADGRALPWYQEGRHKPGIGNEREKTRRARLAAKQPAGRKKGSLTLLF